MAEEQPITHEEVPTPDEAHWLGRWFAAARTQGFLSLLSAEAWQTLCVLLSFTTADGHCAFTLDRFALILDLAPETARERLEDLSRIEWADQPLARVEVDPEGAIMGAQLASLELLTEVTGAAEPDDVGNEPDTPGPEVEGIAAELEALGLYPEQIAWLLRSFSVPWIRRQLDWLPARHARNSAAMLLKAIQEDWRSPREQP